jgi:hypothetical protein
MASAGDYSPIQTPFFWYPEFMAIMKKLVPDFVFKCQEIKYVEGDDKASEIVRHTWSYSSESSLILASILVKECEFRYVYTHKYTKVMYIVFEPIMYMGGWITGTILCVYDPTCKKDINKKYKCKCEGCMSKIQVNVHYYPDQTSNPNDILKALEFNYLVAQERSWGNVKIEQTKIKNESKRLPKQVIKPYVEMKTNIPEQMVIKDEDYFIESWM